MAKQARKARRTTTSRKVKRQISTGQVHVFASFNNTIVTITDLQGNTICWGSSGSAGFKGSRKSTPFAARLAAEQTVKTAQQMGLQEVEMFVKAWSWSGSSYSCSPIIRYPCAHDHRYDARAS